jgi:hypothetical protein
MTRNFISGLRVPIFLRSPKHQDCFFLTLLFFISSCPFILKLGFYADDWAFLASMRLSPNQSVHGLFQQLMDTADGTIRPVQFFVIALLYKSFGLHAVGYHLVSGLFFAIGVALLYFLLNVLRQPRVLSMSICIIFMLLPNYSTDRFWLSCVQVNISLCFFLLTVYFHLKARYSHRYLLWRWELLAIFSLIASAFSYEVFLPLFLLIAALLFISELATDSPDSTNPPSFGKALLHQTGIVIAVVFTVLVKAVWQTRVPHGFDAVDYLYSVLHSIVRASALSYGYHLLIMPYTTIYAINTYADYTMLGIASIVGILVFVSLYIMSEQLVSASISRSNMLMYIGCGIAIFICGYSLFPLEPSANSINNRAAIAGTLGVGVSVVGLLTILTSFVPGMWRRVTFSTVVAFISFGGALIINVLASFWIEAYRWEKEILVDIYDHNPIIPNGASFLLDGVCTYNGPAPVFESSWDLTGALALRYGRADISANTITRSTTVGQNGVIFPAQGNRTYSFGRLFVYNFERKQSYKLSDFQEAQTYFHVISEDRGADFDDYGRCFRTVVGHRFKLMSAGHSD